MTWDVNSRLWDTLNLGGETWPGIWKTTSPGLTRTFEIKKAKDVDGLMMTDQGVSGPAVDFVGMILPNEWGAVKNLLATHTPLQPGAKRHPLPVRGPLVDALKIGTVVIANVKIDPPGPGGAVRITLKCLQWFPKPKPVKDDKAKETLARQGTKGERAQEAFRNINTGITPDIKPGRDAANDALMTEAERAAANQPLP